MANSFNITIQGIGPLTATINKIAGKIKNAKPSLEKIGDQLEKFFQKNMQSEGSDLLKTRWRKLDPRTIAAKARLGFGGKKILERTGTLRRGIKKISVSNRELVVGNNVNYYKFHQLGGKKIPQRQMLGVSRDVEKIVVDQFKKDISFK